MAPYRRKLPEKLSPLAGAAALFLLLLTLATARNGDPGLYPPPPERAVAGPQRGVQGVVGQGDAGQKEAGQGEAGQAVSIYLVDNGFHTDLAIPASALAGRLSGRAAAGVTGGRPWVLVGYGDRSFYIARGPVLARAADGARSLLAPGNPAVLRFDGLAAAPDRVWQDGVTRIRLTPRGLAAMTAAIDASLKPAQDGAPIPVPGASDPASGFFAARQPFSLIHLCNHWTADMLHAAGLPETPVLDTFPAGLKLDLRLRAKVG